MQGRSSAFAPKYAIRNQLVGVNYLLMVAFLHKTH
jgi:hypothetical protein